MLQFQFLPGLVAAAGWQHAWTHQHPTPCSCFKTHPSVLANHVPGVAAAACQVLPLPQHPTGAAAPPPLASRPTFLCLPITFPVWPMTTAVFQMLSPCASSRSRMGDTMTMPQRLAMR
jgi:hypothetical protein